jgi:glucose-1-phosphate cytidylyltransferase
VSPQSQNVKPASVPVFILAGGMGTRISEETHVRPKPMIEIGGMPILLHIMKLYHQHGFEDFVICAGYLSWDIKDYFLNYCFRTNNLEIDHRTDFSRAPSSVGKNEKQEKWRVRVLDTGVNNMTGSRLAQALDIVAEQQKFDHFAVTYGDGLADMDLQEELAFHCQHDRIGTVLGVPPLSRWGELNVSDTGDVVGFLEKPEDKQGLINGGFFFFRSEFRKYLSRDEKCVLERKPMESLALDGQLKVHPHHGFWHAMDTLRDKFYLQELWDSGKAAWRSHAL